MFDENIKSLTDITEVLLWKIGLEFNKSATLSKVEITFTDEG